MSFRELWSEIAPIGRDPGSGGYVRYAWTSPELELRDWFRAQAASRGLVLEEDGNGNIFAWWGDPASGNAVLTGSHLDSVPHGGAYDGPLGVVSSLLAIDELRKRGLTPARPICVGVFAEEEGSRFGLACLGSRLVTGAVTPEKARSLVDRDGLTLAEALTKAGGDPDALGPRPNLMASFGCFVELHVEQGRSLIDSGAAVGVASSIWPHGRWRFTFTGEGNHAGTTLMADRHDPMLTAAFTVLAANKEARLRGAHATVGRIEVAPNATNAIPSEVRAWLDARAGDPTVVDELVAAVTAKAQERSARDGTAVTVSAESVSGSTDFDTVLRDRLAAVLGGAPILPTGAGHDAGVLSGLIPTAMLFVRNPTGVSHSPAESATDEDCEAGVLALADVLADLAC